MESESEELWKYEVLQTWNLKRDKRRGFAEWWKRNEISSPHNANMPRDYIEYSGYKCTF